uniref:GHMP kinase C-terminal domain-containing protein n=1 Tax=Coccolithus braarudii TaxID=221442 RepID=A0A7S0PXY3_9EUKA|mmetsp:Transcript_11659/g.25336  ORF Transcript_11659/g.25336 Transcript_11659/m.25336 type:complete len:200 (+) Transcript_11659:1-600(+)
MPLRPTFVLSVEMEELGIQAGLQDRVIQVYEGCMYMDFNRLSVEERGYGDYSRLPCSSLPPLWLAYVANPSNSGKIHSDVKARWKAGDAAVLEAMQQFGRFTDIARDALLVKDWAALGKAMNDNFALRRRIYGDACLGADNLKMISIASELGVPAKFSGSGGAVLGMCTEAATLEALKASYASNGFEFVELTPHEQATK